MLHLTVQKKRKNIFTKGKGNETVSSAITDSKRKYNFFIAK